MSQIETIPRKKTNVFGVLDSQQITLQILGSDLNPQSDLKIAHLYDSIELPTAESPGKFDPSKSDDKFYIQYKDPSLKETKTIEINLKTQNIDSSYDESTKITLYEVEPGIFRSKELVLVSNKALDQYGIDNILEDQTFLAALNGKVSASYTATSGITYQASASVSAKQVIETQITVLLDEKGIALASREQIAEQIATAQEYYASEGMLLVVKEPINYVPFPPGLSAKEGLNEERARTLNDYLRGNHYTTYQNINFVFAGDQFVEDFAKKEAVMFAWPQPGLAKNNYPTTYNIFTKTNPFVSSALAHELGHALLLSAAKGDDRKLRATGHDQSNHHSDKRNLMLGRHKKGEKNIFGPEHFTKAQGKLMSFSPYAKTLKTPKPYEGIQSIPVIRF